MIKVYRDVYVEQRYEFEIPAEAVKCLGGDMKSGFEVEVPVAGKGAFVWQFRDGVASQVPAEYVDDDAAGDLVDLEVAFGGKPEPKPFVVRVEYADVSFMRETGFLGWAGTCEMVSQLNPTFSCLTKRLEAGGLSLPKRVSCEAATRRLTIGVGSERRVVEGLREHAWTLRSAWYGVDRFGRDVACLEFMQPACPNLVVCESDVRVKGRKLVYWPRVQFPEIGAGPDDNGLMHGRPNITRKVVSCVAGCIARLRDPAYPDKLVSYYERRGFEIPFPLEVERFPSCRSCVAYVYVSRGNEEGMMRSPSTGDLKDDGVYPVDWCAYKGDWIEGMTEARARANEERVSLASSRGQWLLNQGATVSACPGYVWRTHVVAHPGCTYPRHGAAFTPWVRAARSVILDGDHIVARVAGVEVRMEVRPEWRAFVGCK